jgi:hypothetical protein
MSEHRVLPRHRTFIKGRIYYNNGLSSTDCIVRDVSDGGGRLEVPESVVIPDAFELHFPNKNERFHARVRWRKAGQLGVTWGAEQSAKDVGDDGERTEHSTADRLAKLEKDVAELQRRLERLEDVDK